MRTNIRDIPIILLFKNFRDFNLVLFADQEKEIERNRVISSICQEQLTDEAAEMIESVVKSVQLETAKLEVATSAISDAAK